MADNTRKINELGNLTTPDGNDFLLVLQQSNDGTGVFQTFKTEISSLLGSEIIQSTITENVAANLGNLNDVLSRLVFDATTQQIKIANSAIGFELSKDPSTPLEAATKQYVDSRETAIRAYVDTQDAVFDDMFDSKLDLAGGTMTGEIILDSDYPANPRAAVNANYVQEELNAINVDGKLDLAGGTMTGALILSGAPTQDLQAATKSYVDTTVALGAPDIDSDDIPEGTTNLYFTESRARSAISATGDLAYDAELGEISYTAPTAISAFTNDAEYINKDVANLTYYTSTADLESNYPDRNELKTVAYTGSYVDLRDKPAFFDRVDELVTKVDNLADVASTGSYIDLTNRPILAVVATSGSYNDLSDKPAGLDLSALTSDDIREGAVNKFATTGRVRAMISGGPGIVYDSATGIISSVDEAARAALSGGAGIVYNSATGVFSVDTAVIATQAYVASQIASKDNSDEITEGTTNLYFTDARARNAVSVTGDLAYDAATGVFSYTAPAGFSGSYNDLTDKPTIPTAYTLPTASTTVLGGVKVDGTTITINASGVISAVGGGGSVGTDPTFTSVTATTVNIENLNFTGTGPVTFTSNNDLNFVAAGTAKVNNEKILTLTQLKTVVAASVDCADFKTRIQGLS